MFREPIGFVAFDGLGQCKHFTPAEVAAATKRIGDPADRSPGPAFPGVSP